MEEHLKKIKELLKFYKKNNIEIEFKVSYKGGITVSGTIIGISCLFNNEIILQSSSSGSRMKVFLEDIEPGSIFPLEFEKKENKKENKNKEHHNPISPTLRFAILSRDNFKCQYCGISGNNSELEVDHKIPISCGGTNDLSNLKTSCFKCNRGKGGNILNGRIDKRRNKRNRNSSRQKFSKGSKRNRRQFR